MTDAGVPEEDTVSDTPGDASFRARFRASARRVVFSRAFWLILAVPIALAIAQVWHRLADGLGSRPVREVRALQGGGAIPSVGSPEFLSALSALTETSIMPGHDLELLFDGPGALRRMIADMREARNTILVQTYSCAPGQVMDSIRTQLSAKSREGLEVLFLLDGFGCRGLSDAFFDSLRVAGVRVATVRPVKWYSMHRALHRSHVRSVIIDSHVGYTGGFGFSDKWIPGDDGPPWHETTVRFTGPAVRQLAGAFAIGWADATGEVLAGEGMYPLPAPPVDSGIVAGVMFTTRTYGTPVPERYLALSLAGARRTVYIANPYFIPNADLRRWLKEAAARGVDVRVLTASDNIDVKLTYWAARSTYRELLEAGVRIAEYTPAMLHAKTMVIDGVFGSVGSLNLDNVSLRINDEVVLLTQDSTAGATLDSSFLADLAKAEEVTLDDLRRRSIYEAFMTAVARLVRDFL